MPSWVGIPTCGWWGWTRPLVLVSVLLATRACPVCHCQVPAQEGDRRPTTDGPETRREMDRPQLTTARALAAADSAGARGRVGLTRLDCAFEVPLGKGAGRGASLPLFCCGCLAQRDRLPGAVARHGAAPRAACGRFVRPLVLARRGILFPGRPAAAAPSRAPRGAAGAAARRALRRARTCLPRRLCSARGARRGARGGDGCRCRAGACLARRGGR